MEILGALAVLVFLVGIFAFMFRNGAKYRGRGIPGFNTRARDPGDIRWVAAVMGGLAIGSFLGNWVGAAWTTVGGLLGVVLGVMVLFPSVAGQAAIAAINLVAGLAALYGLGEILVGRAPGVEGLGVLYRVNVVVVLVASFAVGVLLSGSTKALFRLGGLGLFGLVDVLGFLLQPGGHDTIQLGAIGVGGYLVVVCLLSAVVGWAASPWMVGVLAMAVAVIQLYGLAISSKPEAAMTGIVAAVVGGLVAAFGMRIFGLKNVA